MPLYVQSAIVLIMIGHKSAHNLVIELGDTRTDFERNRLADVVSSLRAVAGNCGDALLDMLVITIGWHISAIGRIAFEFGVVNERHLAISKFRSFR